MGYNVELTIDTGGAFPHVLKEFSITCNVREMYAAVAYGESISDWDNASALYMISIFDMLLANLHDESYETILMEKMNKNGWGTLPQLKSFIGEVRYWCIEHPLANIKVTY